MIKKFLLGLIGLIVISLAVIILWPEKKYEPYHVSAEYQAQVDAFNVPGMPPDWTWKSHQAEDGTRLRWGETGNRDAARASVVIVPGYTATLDMYGEHVDYLARSGMHVVGVDMRGQGGSERHREEQPEKLWVDDFSVYSDDLAAFIEAQAFPQNRPTILLGISFGGHVATRMAGDHETRIDGLFLIAPALRPMAQPYTLEEATRLVNVARRFGKARHYTPGQGNWQPDGFDFTVGSNCSSNPKRLYYRDVIFTRNPDQRVGGVTNQWGAEFFESSFYVLGDGYLEAIDIPVSIISADHEDFVVTEVNSDACDTRFPNCREVRIPGTGHCLLQESDEVLQLMFDEIDALIEWAAPETSGAE